MLSDLIISSGAPARIGAKPRSEPRLFERSENKCGAERVCESVDLVKIVSKVSLLYDPNLLPSNKSHPRVLFSAKSVSKVSLLYDPDLLPSTKSHPRVLFSAKSVSKVSLLYDPDLLPSIEYNPRVLFPPNLCLKCHYCIVLP